MTKYWINAITLDHVKLGLAEGFTQAGHGKATRLKLLAKDDWMVFYSSRQRLEKSEAVQAFTAIGQMIDSEPYRFDLRPDFKPWRRRLRFESEAITAPIHPLIDDLEFIPDPRYWGFPFRRGLFQISEADFLIIARAMQVE